MSEDYRIISPARGEPRALGQVGVCVRVQLSGHPSRRWSRDMGARLRVIGAVWAEGKVTEKYILKMGWTPIPINGSIARIMLNPSIALRVRQGVTTGAF